MTVTRFIFTFFLAQAMAFLIFELGFNIFQNFKPIPYYQAKKILEYDSGTVWKHRNNLNTNFLGGKFTTNPDGFRSKKKTPSEKVDVLLLGPSSAVGWNVNDDETYSQILSKLSTREVFNASQIGFTIDQGKHLFRKYFQNKKIKTVLLSFGINELDYFPFWNSKNSLYNFSRNYFNSIDFLLDSFKSFEGTFSCTSEIRVKQRMSLEQFENVADEFIKDLKLKNIQVLLLNTAHNYGSYNSKLKKHEVLDSTQLFNDYKKLFNAGDCANARDAFIKAKKFDSFRIENQIKEVNFILWKLSQKYSIPLIDIDKAISNKNHYFFDHIHFSKAGNEEISKLILEEL